jgi:uncharacterized membrane protein
LTPILGRGEGSFVDVPHVELEELGVVEPWRLPAAVEGMRARLTNLGWAFVALAVIDLIGRWTGGLAPGLSIDADPRTWTSAIGPHAFVILLPAVILLRRRDPATATPVILRAAVLIAAVEFARGPAIALASALSPSGDGSTFPAVSFGAQILASSATLVLVSIGWFSLARGLALITVAPASALARVLGFAVVASFALSVLGDMAVTLLGRQPLPDELDPIVAPLFWIQRLAIYGWTAGLAYLGWVVVRGVRDPQRPARATTVAVIAVTLEAATALLIWTLASISIVAGGAWSELLLAVGGSLGWILNVMPLTLLVFAFAIGLADPRPLGSASESPD